jgi:RNA polymerase sigma-70 factor (ECF subfamily)
MTKKEKRIKKIEPKADINSLLKQCKKGNEMAYMQVYKLYYKAMYSISYRILNDKSEAEDIMQESFLTAFQKLDTYEGKVEFGAWLKRIVINRSIDLIRSRKRNPVFTDDIEGKYGDNLLEDKSELDAYNFNQEQVARLKRAIKQLPDGYRIILSLYLLEGYDHQEISRIAGISHSSSRSQYTRAKKKLVELLKKT